jgi:hypothetical protein
MTILLSTLEYLFSAFAGVMARVESLRGRISAFEPRESTRQVEGLFESLLSESFGEHISLKEQTL